MGPNSACSLMRTSQESTIKSDWSGGWYHPPATSSFATEIGILEEEMHLEMVDILLLCQMIEWQKKSISRSEVAWNCHNGAQFLSVSCQIKILHLPPDLKLLFLFFFGNAGPPCARRTRCSCKSAIASSAASILISTSRQRKAEEAEAFVTFVTYVTSDLFILNHG